MVLITGASTGIGAAAARAFARGQQARHPLQREPRARRRRWRTSAKRWRGAATLVGGDVTESDERQADRRRSRWPRYGRIDVLINNAGGMLGRMKIEDYTDEYIEQVLALNCTQVALFMREVDPGRCAGRSRGNVINVTSIAARHGGGGGAILYAGAKGFISDRDAGWAKEVVGDGIRVNAVSPGVITTPFHDRYSTAEQLKAMQATIPMNRLGQRRRMRRERSSISRRTR